MILTLVGGVGLADVWVDFSHDGVENGTFDAPFDTLAEGLAAASPGETIQIKAGSSCETLVIDQSVMLDSFGGAAVVGRGPTLGTGPDIVVSGVGSHSISNFMGEGGIRAYSFSTTSCNAGDEVINWYNGIGNDHPLIGQNLFRLHQGRIEQLGYSFLKHGFCALDQNACGPCQAVNDCGILGIGCSDTYGSFLNDGSNGASKRSVNPTLGTYVGNPGPTGSPAIAGRLQVLQSELAGTLIAEAQYVSEHDHMAGLARNNVSWREMTANGADELSGNGEVQMGDPAIFAWAAYSGASITTVCSLDEGADGVHGYYFVGHQVTNLGDGTWRYEYAIQNLNSDRAVQAFVVPLPSGVTPSAGYFRGVRHHSGDPYSNQAWTYTASEFAASWECESYATNPNANALRWGTLYNFGFTTDRPPRTAEALLRMFKPGGPDALQAVVQVPQ